MKKFRKSISGLLAFVMLCSAFVCNMAVTASAADGDYDYWFAEHTDELEKGEHQIECGTVELISNFTEGGGFTYATHKSYHGTSSKNDNKAYPASGNVGASATAVPTDGNAYAFTPNADGIVTFYGATGSGKTYYFAEPIDGVEGNYKFTSINNTDVNLGYTANVKAGKKYYMSANNGTNATAFVGFKYVNASNLQNGTVSWSVTSGEGHGTVTVKNGGTDVQSGDTIDGGTSLTLTASPAPGYFAVVTKGDAESVKLTDENTYTWEVNGDITFNVEFKQEAEMTVITESYTWNAGDTGVILEAGKHAELPYTLKLTNGASIHGNNISVNNSSDNGASNAVQFKIGNIDGKKASIVVNFAATGDGAARKLNIGTTDGTVSKTTIGTAPANSKDSFQDSDEYTLESSDKTYYLASGGSGLYIKKITIKITAQVSVTPQFKIEGALQSDGTYTINGVEHNVTDGPITLDSGSYDVLFKTSSGDTYTGTLVVSEGNPTPDVELTKAVNETVTGEFSGPSDYTNTKVKFTRAGVPTQAEVTDGSYTVELAPGTYSVSVEGLEDGYTLGDLSKKDFTVVHDGNNVRNFYASKPAAAVTAEDIYVGVDSKKGDANYFETLREAMAAINVSSQPKYVVHLQGGKTYKEQVVVKKDNVTFTTDGTGDATISWYYGFGYEYYSVNPTTGRYDEEYAFLKTEKDNPEQSISKWASTVIVEGNNFYAENIIFENTFNFKVTDEEKADGVAPAQEPYQTKVGDKSDRTVPGFDPQNKAATERAGVICIPGAKAEFYKCQFLSSQDTIVTNNSAGVYYMNDCTIVGETDYICGYGNLIVDNSKLLWKGYSDSVPSEGYITASQGNYLLRNCTVGSYSAGSLGFGKGYYGRPWSVTSKTIFVNTKFDGNETDFIDTESVTTASKNDVQYYKFYKGWGGSLTSQADNPKNLEAYTSTATLDLASATKEISPWTVNTQFKTGEETSNLTGKDLTGATYLGAWVPAKYTEELNPDTYDIVDTGETTYDFRYYDSSKDQGDNLDAIIKDSVGGKAILEVSNIKNHGSQYGSSTGNTGSASFTMAKDANETTINISSSFERNQGKVDVYVNGEVKQADVDVTNTDPNGIKVPVKLSDLKAGDVVKIDYSKVEGTFYTLGITVVTDGAITDKVPVITTATWNFRTGNYTAQEITKGSSDKPETGGFEAAEKNGIVLKADTKDGGKLNVRTNDWAQFTEDAKLIVPVYAVGDIIAIESYNTTSYKINDAPYTASTSYTVKDTDVEKGYVEVISTDNTGNGYIGSITLTTKGEVPEPVFKFEKAVKSSTEDNVYYVIGKISTEAIENADNVGINAALSEAGALADDASQLSSDTVFSTIMDSETEIEKATDGYIAAIKVNGATSNFNVSTYVEVGGKKAYDTIHNVTVTP